MRLAPLLKLLRSHGVAEYVGKDFTVRFAGGDAPELPAPRGAKKLEPRLPEDVPRDAMELAMELSRHGVSDA